MPTTASDVGLHNVFHVLRCVLQDSLTSLTVQLELLDTWFGGACDRKHVAFMVPTQILKHFGCQVVICIIMLSVPLQ